MSTTCSSCHREIDPDCCCCGEPYTDERGNTIYHDGHAFTPMGCVCGYPKKCRACSVADIGEGHFGGCERIDCPCEERQCIEERLQALGSTPW